VCLQARWQQFTDRQLPSFRWTTWGFAENNQCSSKVCFLFLFFFLPSSASLVLLPPPFISCINCGLSGLTLYLPTSPWDKHTHVSQYSEKEGRYEVYPCNPQNVCRSSCLCWCFVHLLLYVMQNVSSLFISCFMWWLSVCFVF
jgi:hypothetical protein